MKEFYIYYRGQNINQIKARNEADALARHFKRFNEGAFKSIARAADSSMESFKQAITESQQPR